MWGYRAGVTRPRDGGFIAAADLWTEPRFQIQIYRRFTSHVGETCYPGTIDGGEHPTVNIGLGRFKI